MTSPPATASQFEVAFLNVGQGDCTVASDLESGEALVIDCPTKAFKPVLKRLRSMSLRKVDIVVTHWDQDHYAGVVDLAKNLANSVPKMRLLYNHDTLLVGGKDDRTRRLTRLRSFLDPSLDSVVLAPAVDGATGTVGPARWSMLAPTHRELTGAVTTGDRNAGSAVLHLLGEGMSVLVGGDAQDGIWRRLIASGRLPQADTFRCSHHGGHTGPDTGGALSEVLAVVKPQEVVISVGSENDYGHPLPTVVGAVRDHGARVMCTEVTARCHAALSGTEKCAGEIVLRADASVGYVVSPNLLEHQLSINLYAQALCGRTLP